MARTSTCLRLALPAVTLMAFALPAAQVTVANAAPAAASQASYAYQGEAYGFRVNVGREGPLRPVSTGLSRVHHHVGAEPDQLHGRNQPGPGAGQWHGDLHR